MVVYFYFKDKYDIRNKLISHKAGELFSEAHDALEASHITGFTAQLHFIVDNILDRLETESSLLGFISKNLSWGVFKDAFQEQADDDDFPFFQEYLNLLDCCIRIFLLLLSFFCYHYRTKLV